VSQVGPWNYKADDLSLTRSLQGGVYETICKGVRLAWKTKYCSRGIRAEQLREMDILRRLSHHHIIRLMGTYTQGLFLGLLLAPVAVCDLKTFMEDIDTLRDRLAKRKMCKIENTEMMRRLDELCPDTSGGSDLHQDAVSRLSSYFGRLVGVITYLHEQRIRHKDIKPSNVLLSHRGVWLADFGISSDFSDLSSSQSEAADRGTPKYFAPEVATFKKSGRPADIFSLGCIFLEMVALLGSVPLDELKVLRPEQDGSFQANLQHKTSWFTLLGSDSVQLQHLLCEIESMINEDAKSRPLAFQLDRHLAIIAQFGGNRSRPLHGPCCARERFIDQVEHMTKEIEDLRLEVMQRDEYIDDLMHARPPSRSRSPSEIPRPPLGLNFHGMVRTNVSSSKPSKAWRGR
jgi:serine/threonine protein kinase